MSLEIRKFIKSVDCTLIEGGKKAEKPVELVSVAAVITNPSITPSLGIDITSVLTIDCSWFDFLTGGTSPGHEPQSAYIKLTN